jgi:signal transduction histidine kinase
MNKILEQKVQERTAALTSINRDIESFSYTVSHDLRIPVRNIRGLAILLKQDAPPNLGSEFSGYIERIQKSAEQMNSIIEGLLLLSQVSRRPIERSLCNLSQMAHVIIESFSDPKSHHVINWHIEPNLLVYADRNLLLVLIQNLLSNALKFTRNCDVAEVFLGKYISESGMTGFFVQDNGIGFHSAQALEMFKPFTRLSNDSNSEGHGIGLATTARIVERHQGRIRAEGVVGRGACIFVEIPSIESAFGESNVTIPMRF